jgi:hypothetical protein
MSFRAQREISEFESERFPSVSGGLGMTNLDLISSWIDRFLKNFKLDEGSLGAK